MDLVLRPDSDQSAIQTAAPGTMNEDLDQQGIPHTGPGPMNGDSDPCSASYPAR